MKHYYKTALNTSLLLLIWLLSISNSLAQTADLLIDTQASGPVNVCGAAITFTTTIRNQSSGAVQSVKFYPQLPSGMVYVAGSAIGMTVSNSLPASLSFSIADFSVDEEKIVQFQAKADCDLLTGLSSSRLVNNNTKITYQLAGVSSEILEPNGSESYSVLSAELELFVPEIENNIAADFINVVKSRHITIKNTGLGSLSSIDFYLKADAELALQKLELVKSSGNQLLTSSATVALGKKYTLTDFTSAGDGDNLFEEGESIVLLDYVKVLTGKASISTVYTAQWGCSNKVCNLTDQQSVFTAYITAIGGRASIDEFVYELSNTDFCNKAPAQLRYELKNNGSGNLPATRDAAFNLKWQFSVTEFSQQGSHQFFIQKNDQSLVEISLPVTYPNSTILNGTGYYDFNNIFWQDVDGVGGLEDTDQDGYFDDLPSGNTLRLIVYIKPTFTGDVSAVTNSIGAFYSASLFFTSWSGVINKQNTSHGGQMFVIIPNNSSLTGFTDLESSSVGTLILTSDLSVGPNLIDLSKSTFEIDLDLPLGVSLVNAKFNNKDLAFTQDGNLVKITDPFFHTPHFSVNLQFSLDCSSAAEVVKDDIKADVYWYSDPVCTTNRFKVNQLSKEIFLHCGNCTTVETTQFTATRKTLGWAWTNNYSYTYAQLYGPASTVARATPSTPGIRLDAAYPLDQVEASVKGKLAGGQSSNLSAKIEYRSGLSIEMLNYSSSIFILNGIEYPLPPSFQPVKTITNGLYRYIYDIPLGTLDIPFTITAGQAFELKANYQVDRLYNKPSGEYPLSDFRGGFSMMLNGVNTSCQDFGDNFLILRPALAEQSIYSSGSYLTNTSDPLVIGYFYVHHGNNSLNSVSLDFPNEFRPLMYPTISSTALPKGFLFDDLKPVEFYVLGRQGTIPAIFSPDKRTVTFNKDDIPIPNSGYSVLQISAHVKIDCENPDNLYEPVNPSTYDQRLFNTNYQAANYAYLPSATDHIVTSNLAENFAMYNARRSNLQLTANSQQEGYSDIVKWPIQICNPYYDLNTQKSLNTWVAVELKNDDSSTILQSVVDQNNVSLPVVFYGPKDSDHPNGRNILVKLGTLQVSNCIQLNVIARYKNCEDNKQQDVNVYASWDYNAYPNVNNYEGSVKDHRGCEGFLSTGTLSVKYKTAALQWEVAKNGPEAVDLCIPVNFDIDLTSTKYGDMNQLKVWFELPHNLTFDPANPPQFHYPYNAPGVAIPAAAFINENGKTGWEISKIIGMNLPGTRLANNKIRLDFNLVSSCGFDPGLPIKYSVTGYTNCGDFIQFTDQRKIKLQGFSLDDLELQLTAAQPPKCNSENDFTLSLKNVGDQSSSLNQLEVMLPAGVEYRNLLQSDLPAPAASQVNGQTKLTWTLASDYLASGQQKSLVLRTFLVSNSGASEITFSARTYQTADAYCPDSNSSCSTQATSGNSTLSLKVGLQSALEISFDKYLCAYHFNPTVDASEGCSITGYAWSFGDNTTSVETNPFHAFNQPGTYTVSLNINFNCGGCSGTQSKEIQVVVSPNTDEFKETTISISTDTKSKVLQSSAATFSDTWPLSHTDPLVSNQNSYLNGNQGVWRNDGAYAYNTSREQSSSVDVSKDGTYSLLNFSWKQAELEAIPGWIKANSITQYSPYSYELENRDVLGVYSSALYDYGGHLPSANGVNMRNNEMAFTSFENMDNQTSGNWVLGNQPLPAYTQYDVYYGYGNMAIVKASLEELANVEKANVYGRKLQGFLTGHFKYISDDNIICKQPYVDHPDWTVIVLQFSPSENLWVGGLQIKKEVQPSVVATFDNAVSHSGKQSLHIISAQTFSQPLLQLDSGKRYMVGAWVSVGNIHLLTPKLADNLGIDLIIKNKQNNILSTTSFQPSGRIIEGWQQVKGYFTVPDVSTNIEIAFKPGTTNSAWYDDLRLHPEKGNMKSYVYNLSDYRLQAILDEENFASFYYYDQEGNLHLVKKETEEGIKTISENTGYTVERDH